jgi:acyl-CoA synthetase (AMP-forming)/AMP-acid ligase II/thioesterase domain-containing protein/acyl carrier protein
MAREGASSVQSKPVRPSLHGQAAPATGRRIGVVARNSPAYVNKIFALWDEGHAVVPLRSEDDSARREAAGVEEVIQVGEEWPWLTAAVAPRFTDDLALIAFTSGTESAPRGVALTHRALADVVVRLNDVMKLDEGVREYIGVPVHLSFGFGRCRAVAAAGGQAFVPPYGFSPVEIARMVDTDLVNAISLVPSQWRVVLEKASLIRRPQQVRWIEIGSQYMSGEEKSALRRLFPQANIVEHYGLTEASRTTLLEVHRAPEEVLDSIGRVYGETEVRLTDRGHIAIRGPHLGRGYVSSSGEEALVDKDGWFVTNDLGQERGGYLFYAGRADDVINFSGVKVSPEQLETELFAALGQSQNLALCRRPDPAYGDGFLVAVTPDCTVDRATLYRVLLNCLRARGINAGRSIAFVDVLELPRTVSGKVRRKLISEAHQDAPTFNISDSTNRSIRQMANDEQRLRDVCEEIFGIKPIDSDDNFFDLGVSSLDIIKLMVKLFVLYDKELSANDVFKNPTVAQLSALIHGEGADGEHRNHAVDVVKVGDGGPPFFFVGSPVYGNHLSKKLRSEAPFYTLNIFGLDELYSSHLHDFTVQDIAREFHREVKRIQPRGPYALGAYCADQNIAFELARLLVDDGESLRFVGFFDVNSHFTTPMSTLEKIRDKLTTVGPRYVLEFAAGRYQRLTEGLRIAASRRKVGASRCSQQKVSVVHRDRMVISRFHQANREYTPTPLPIDVVAYRSREWSRQSLETLRHCVKGVEVHIIAGTHSDMFLKQSSLEDLASLVDRHLLIQGDVL